ncbi:MAG: flagellar biosynthetic protein FliR [Bdellovibrionales bacterium]|nr:flagellar biosynthetic protein FliR [Bdellovibrionales bacterium]
MCELGPEVGSLIARAASFILFLFVIPYRVVPLVVRAALLVAVVAFVGTGQAGAGGIDGCSFERLLSLDPQVLFPGWAAMLAEILTGAALGVMLSVTGWGIYLLGGSLSAAMFGAWYDYTEKQGPVVDAEKRFQSLLPVALLLLLIALFDLVPEFVGEIFRMLVVPLAQRSGTGGGEMVLQHSLSLPFGELWKIVTTVGADAFVLALLLLGPYLACVVLVDVGVVVFNRFVRRMATTAAVSGVRIPVLTLALSLGVYGLVAEIEAHLKQSTAPEAVRAVVRRSADGVQR